MLLDTLRRLFSDRAASSGATSLPNANAGSADAAAPGPNDVQIAACALLLELAWADGEFTAEERRAIASALERHFGVTGIAADELLSAAERELEGATDHFSFTRRLVAGYDLSQRVVLAEVMWTVALADGTLADHEAYLVRKVANLLDLEPAYLSQARQRAAASGSP